MSAPITRRGLALLLVLAACTPGNTKPDVKGITGENHTFFPIAAGSDHAMGRVVDTKPIDCISCHLETAATYAEVSCTGCHIHDQQISELLHRGDSRDEFSLAPTACLTCHPMGDHKDFGHVNLKAMDCATCHDLAAPWNRLPFTDGGMHRAVGALGCGACHNTIAWRDVTGAPAIANDPATDVTVNALVPVWSATSIAALNPLSQQLPQDMNHKTSSLTSQMLDNCGACHPFVSAGTYFPGVLHPALSGLGATVSTCGDCHARSVPEGFVGLTATNPARTPPSGEMRHDAVAWDGGAPTTQALVIGDCSQCHFAPVASGATDWTTASSGTGRARFHLPLTSQPSSCLDCHANTRPVAPLTLSSGVSFNHQNVAALGDCKTCHADSAAVNGLAWDAGRFHLPGDPVPSTCLPCHEGERPLTTAGWAPGYTNRPFDYVPNARGNTHGDAQDCALCHRSTTQTWAGGDFVHGPGTPSANRCVSCHTTQRPIVPVNAFDHSRDGTGDCFACHQATVVANRYQTMADWDGGAPYPASFVSSSDLFITVPSTTLIRSGPNNLVTSTSTSNVSLYEGMLHTSTAIPPAMRPSGASDTAKCDFCHTTGQYRDGRFHPAVTDAGFAQPVSQCNDCHGPMLPPGIVQRGTSTLFPMDHRQKFTNDGGPAELECSVCHRTTAGGTWADGEFHARIGAAVPRDCNGCHYLLMATPLADLTNGTRYKMQHRSGQITFQSCDTCHPMALARGAATPADAGLWSGGAYHPRLSAQPGGCIDCHAVKLPNASTQSAITYVLGQGGTATNGAQWMSHASARVVGRDCVVCHRSDATRTAWPNTSIFHGSVAAPTTCRECHGLTNGNGAVPGTRNNLPAGLTDSVTLTTAIQNAMTGVPAGTHDQISHADLNVTGRDCNFCHTQQGADGGQVWARATFHPNFSAGSPLVMNDGTGRCSNCHLNVAPRASFTGYDHTALTALPGSVDCASCHGWPGAGGASAPNWKGAVGGVPATIPVGGFTISVPPATGSVTQAGIANLPHPAVGSLACSACHANSAGGKNAKGYDHATTLIDNKCNACHEAGSDLIGTRWNPSAAGAVNLGASCGEGGGQVRDREGDTRAIDVAAIACRDEATNRTCGSRNCSLNHFYPSDCDECHVKPAAGLSLTKVGSAYVTGWRFDHNENRMQQTTCCMCHPGTVGNCKH